MDNSSNQSTTTGNAIATVTVTSDNPTAETTATTTTTTTIVVVPPPKKPATSTIITTTTKPGRVRKLSHSLKNVKIKNTNLLSKPSEKSKTGLAPPPRRRPLRRSQSFDTMPKMKNKKMICQPITIQRRMAVSRIKVHFRYKDQHLILICLAMISFTSMLAMSIIAPFFPIEAANKGMRESVNGLVFSVYALVLMIFSPVMSVTIPVVGSKLALILGVLVAGVSNILFGLLDKIDDLDLFTMFCFLVRIFEAIGATAFSTATYTILMEEFPDNIGTAFSIVETSVGLGLSLGPAIGGFLYSFGGYGLPFFVLGAIMIATIPMCMFIIRDNNKSFKPIKSPWKAYLKIFSIYKVAVNGFVIVVVAQLLSFLDPTMEPHLRQIGLAPHYVSLVFLIMSATYTLSSPVIGWISNVVPNKFQLMAIGLFLLGIEFLFLGPSELFQLETSFTQTAVTMAFIGVSYSIAFIPTFETLLALSIKNGFPDDIGTYSLVSGIWSSYCSFGEILGPVFGGFLTEHYGFQKASTSMGVCAIVMAIICSITCIYFDEIKPYSKSGLKDGNTKKSTANHSLKTATNKVNHNYGAINHNNHHTKLDKTLKKIRATSGAARNNGEMVSLLV